jgi:hypothetical protein
MNNINTHNTIYAYICDINIGNHGAIDNRGQRKEEFHCKSEIIQEQRNPG